MRHATSGVSVPRWAAAALLAGALLAPARHLPAGEAAPAAGCRVRVILGLVHPLAPPPPDRWVQELAAANGVQLRYLRAITPRLFVFSMGAETASSGCDAALARLRTDSRLRSAEIDQRREHDPG
jgi:hypothetical protein